MEAMRPGPNLENTKSASFSALCAVSMQHTISEELIQKFIEEGKFCLTKSQVTEAEFRPDVAWASGWVLRRSVYPGGDERLHTNFDFAIFSPMKDYPSDENVSKYLVEPLFSSLSQRIAEMQASYMPVIEMSFLIHCSDLEKNADVAQGISLAISAVFVSVQTT